MFTATRRQFLIDIGNGMLVASVGSTLAGHLAATAPTALQPQPHRLPEDLEALIRRMLDSEPDALLPHLVTACRSGTQVGTLVTAGALANARAFGGGDYEGFHAFMALLPSLAMSARMPKGFEPLPVLKVLRRNTARIRKTGGARPAPLPVEAVLGGGGDRLALRQAVRDGDEVAADSLFASACSRDLEAAQDGVQALAQDDLDVHRIVLAWRAWDMLRVAGVEHAHPLLRQIVHYCAVEERQRVAKGHKAPAVRDDLPRLLDQHKLLGKQPGERQPDDAWIEALSVLVFESDRARAGDAVAAALAEGFAPEAVGEAISLAANRLLRHDTGKQRVHGASVGVHASDAANAWRHVARVGPVATRFANLVVGAYHTAGQSRAVGVEPFAHAEQLAQLTSKDPAELLRTLSAAIEQKDQRLAMAAMQRYGDGGHPAEPAFDLLLRYAVSEDGALHAEKYFHTVCEEFASTRPAFRWRHLVGLARVTASEFGEPAPGVAEARQLLEA